MAQALAAIAAVEPDEVECAGGFGGEGMESVSCGGTVVGGIRAHGPCASAILGERGGEWAGAPCVGAGGGPCGEEMVAVGCDPSIHAASQAEGRWAMGVDAHGVCPCDAVVDGDAVEELRGRSGPGGFAGEEVDAVVVGADVEGEEALGGCVGMLCARGLRAEWKGDCERDGAEDGDCVVDAHGMSVAVR